MTLKIGDTVRVTDSRFAVSASPYSELYSKLWKKYGNREGEIVAFTTESAHKIKDTVACVIVFPNGDMVIWETHLVTKVE